MIRQAVSKAVAVGRDHMESRLDESRLRRLMEVGPALIAELDMETLLDRLLDTAREVTRARFAALGVLDHRRQRLERFLTRGLSEAEELAVGERPRGNGILGILITDARPLRLAELAAHPQSFGFPTGHPPMSSFLGVPILIGGAAWGNLYLTDKDGGQFTEEDEEAVVILASWAAIAIEHGRLLSAAGARQDELERALRGLEATQAIVLAVGGETDLTRVLELIAKRGRAIVDARSVVILLQDDDDLVVAAGAGHSHPDAGARVPIAESTSGQVMLSQRSARLTDAAKLRVPAARLGVPEARSALIVPLVYRGRSLGVLAAFDRDGRIEFDEEEEQVLVSFAASAATAVATAQTVQADRLRHSLEAAEAERQHWARELHDETLQTLGGLKLMASTARRAGDTAAMARALDHLVDGLESGIENLHSIISELRPAALDDLGLRPAIEALSERHRATSGFEIDYHLELPDPARDDRRLAPELETTVYRLIQEALTNVAKHAGASRVTVTAGVDHGHVRIEVTDNGRGFAADGITAGFGLTGMRERAALAGGTVDISSDRGGTAVTAVLPSRHAA
jgi:signal transduction histidine kinase